MAGKSGCGSSRGGRRWQGRRRRRGRRRRGGEAAAGGGGGAGAAPRRGLLKPLLLGLGLAAGLGAAGFYAGWSGLLPVPGGGQAGAAAPPRRADTAFVAIAPMVISLGPGARARHLRFAGALEVPLSQLGEVQRLMPRVLDVLNSYLRAVDARAFDEPSALMRLRAQMLRRVQIVLGEGVVRDLLVTEFVLN